MGETVGDIFVSHASGDKTPAARVADGLRQAGHSIFLDADREDGVAPGAAWQRTLLRELRICDAVVFLNSVAGQASKWCHSELVIAADLGKRIYSVDLSPDLPPHPLLGSLQGIAFDTNVEVSIRRLAGELELDGLAASARPRYQRARAPYPGLAAMDVADAGVFFGREDEVRDLVARVEGPLGQREGNLVLVMGPSGAGKSSLVRAGLAARLAAPHKGWAVASPFEPGIKPLDQLASRLAALTSGRLTDIQCRDKLLAEGLAAFGEWLVTHAETPTKQLLITLDQAEQLATVTSPGERDEFVRVLGGGLGRGSPVTTVMTVRSDRFDEVQRLPVIGPAIRAPFVITPISRARLAIVIEGPARRADLAFGAGLAGRLIDDVVRGSSGEAADALPFLAFVLREMYDLAVKEDRAVFTDDDYERVGRIEGAIILRAQAAEASLPPDSEPVLDRLLPRFVALSEERLPAARPVPREALTANELLVAERLEDQRLLVGTDGTVKLAHERLITAWPRLARVVADRRDDLLLQARLRRQAADWKEGQGALLGREATIAATSWLARQGEPGTNQSVVGEYIRACRADLRRQRVRMLSVPSVIVALALAASLVAVALTQRSDAIAQADRALSATVGTAADTLLDSDPAVAGQVSLAAYKLSATPEAYGSILNESSQTLPGQVAQPSAGLNSVAFNASGSLLAAGAADTLQIWQVTPNRITLMSTAYGDKSLHLVPAVWFSPRRGSNLLALLYNKQIGLSIVGSKSPEEVLKNPEGTSPNVLAFSHDGNMVAVGYSNGTIELWNVQNPAQPITIGRPFIAPGAGNAGVTAVTFSPDGSLLAMESGLASGGSALTSTVRLWNIHDPAQPTMLPTTLTSTADLLAFRPVGRILATGDALNNINLWNVTDARHPHAVGTPLSGHTNIVSAMAFSADGNVLATASVDNSVRLWDVTDPDRPEAMAVLGRESSTATFYGISLAPNRLLAAPALTVLNGSTSARTWLWVTDPVRDSKQICMKFATTPITRTQWQEYFPGQPYSPPCPARR